MTHSQRTTIGILHVLATFPDGLRRGEISRAFPALHWMQIAARLGGLRHDALAVNDQGQWRAAPKGIAVLLVLGADLPQDAYRRACVWTNRAKAKARRKARAK